MLISGRNHSLVSDKVPWNNSGYPSWGCKVGDTVEEIESVTATKRDNQINYSTRQIQGAPPACYSLSMKILAWMQLPKTRSCIHQTASSMYAIYVNIDFVKTFQCAFILNNITTSLISNCKLLIGCAELGLHCRIKMP